MEKGLSGSAHHVPTDGPDGYSALPASAAVRLAARPASFCLPASSPECTQCHRICWDNKYVALGAAVPPDLGPPCRPSRPTLPGRSALLGRLPAPASRRGRAAATGT